MSTAADGAGSQVRTVGIDLSATARGTAVVAVDWTTSSSGVHGKARLVCDSADGSAGTESVLDALEDGTRSVSTAHSAGPAGSSPLSPRTAPASRGRPAPSRATGESSGCERPTAISPIDTG